MPLYLVRWPTLKASLVRARDEDELIYYLDEVADPGGCTYKVYKGPVWIDFKLPFTIRDVTPDKKVPIEPSDFTVDPPPGFDPEVPVMSAEISESEAAGEMRLKILSFAFPSLARYLDRREDALCCGAEDPDTAEPYPRQHDAAVDAPRAQESPRRRRGPQGGLTIPRPYRGRRSPRAVLSQLTQNLPSRETQGQALALGTDTRPTLRCRRRLRRRPCRRTRTSRGLVGSAPIELLRVVVVRALVAQHGLGHGDRGLFGSSGTVAGRLRRGRVGRLDGQGRQLGRDRVAAVRAGMCDQPRGLGRFRRLVLGAAASLPSALASLALRARTQVRRLADDDQRKRRRDALTRHLDVKRGPGGPRRLRRARRGPWVRRDPRIFLRGARRWFRWRLLLRRPRLRTSIVDKRGRHAAQHRPEHRPPVHVPNVVDLRRQHIIFFTGPRAERGRLAGRARSLHLKLRTCSKKLLDGSRSSFSELSCCL